MGLRDLFHRSKDVTPEYIGYSNNTRVGIRANNFVISLSECANGLAQKIAKSDTAFLFIPFSSELESSLLAIVSHPNTASAFLLSYGCEAKSSRDHAVELRNVNPNIEFLEFENGALEAFALDMGPAVLQELKFQSSPGLEAIPNPVIALVASSRDQRVNGVLEALNQAHLSVEAILDPPDFTKALLDAARQGALAIINFTQEDQYPLSTYIAPTINIASKSTFHQQIAADFDLGFSATPNEILDRVNATIERSPTASEIAKIFQSFGAQSDTNSSIKVINPILSNFADDITPRISLAGTKIAIATGNEVADIDAHRRDGYEVFTIAESGSLFQLAQNLTKKFQ